MAQLRFWKEFYQLKVHVNYVELHLQRTEMIDRSLKMFLAISSSASIGAWVIWKELAILWACVIAASQVVNIVRSYLPYKERLKALSGLLGDIEELVIYMEMKWIEVSSGKLSDEEINKLRYDIRMKKHKSLKKHFPGTVIPENKKLLSKAEDSASIYFSTFYPS
jgi:hypothetical protein